MALPGIISLRVSAGWLFCCLRAVSWLLSCYLLAGLLLPAAGKQQGNSKETARKQSKIRLRTQKSVGPASGKNDKKEESAGSADDRFSSKKILDGINLSQSVLRQANFLSAQPHICIVSSRVSGAGKNDSLWPQLNACLPAMQAKARYLLTGCTITGHELYRIKQFCRKQNHKHLILNRLNHWSIFCAAGSKQVVNV